jgi:CRISPR-associated protein Csx17
VRVATLSHIAALLSRNEVHAAVEAARHAYHAVGLELADFHAPFSLPNADRLLAALLIPVCASDIAQIFGRWRSPEKLNQQKEKKHEQPKT